MSNRAAFGKGSAEKTSFVKDIKLKSPEENKGETITHFIARIVPPMKSLQDNKKGWAVYVRYHYGHKGCGYKPGSTFSRTFGCVEVVDLKTPDKDIIDHCPKCDEMYAHEAEKERLEALQEKAGGEGKDQKIDEALQAEKDWLYDHSLSVGFKMYVVTPEGVIYRLQISGKAKKGLDAFISECLKNGVDVLDMDKGVYIDFMRTGRNRDVVDTFAIAKTKLDVNGRKAEFDWEAPMDDELLGRILESCPDLNFTETQLTKEEIQELVDCDQAPETVDAIFAKAEKRRKAERAAAKEQEAKDAPPPSNTPAPTTVKVSTVGQTGGVNVGVVNNGTPKPALAPKPVAKPATVSKPQPRPAEVKKVAEDPAAVLMAQIAALQAQLAAQNAPKSEPAQTEEKPFETTEDEFFGEFPEGEARE